MHDTWAELRVSRRGISLVGAALLAACASCSDGQSGSLPATDGTAQGAGGSIATVTIAVPGATAPTTVAIALPNATAAKTELGKVSTAVISESGIDLKKLPVPSGAKVSYVDANVAMYVTEAPVELTAKEVSRLLQLEGWEPYGAAAGTQDFKRYLVRLTASVGAAPAQGGETLIAYRAEKIAVDLPAMADAEGLQYSDATKQVSFDTPSDAATVERFYRDVLGKSEWKATTEKPFQVGLKAELIFRNTPKDMLTLQLQEVEGKRRVTLKHQSAAQVAETEAAYQAELDQKKKDAEKPLPKLKLALPSEASAVERKKNRLNFELPTGRAKSVVDAWRKEFAAAGWKEEVTKADDKVGSFAFRKEKEFLSVDYIDPGFVAGEVTVTTTGVELE